MRRWLSNYFLGIDDWRDLNDIDLFCLKLVAAVVLVTIGFAIIFW